MGWKLKAVGATAALLVLAGCSGGGGGANAESGSATPSATPTPALGGTLGARAKPPSKAMNRLERPIASRLEGQLARQGMTLRYLDCPAWNGRSSQPITCKVYLDGVAADVRVRLTKTTTSVNFHAEVLGGVLSTTNVERQLRANGYADVDCGDTPAYPIVVGSEIVCSAGVGEKEYLVATVLDESGRKVEISKY